MAAGQGDGELRPHRPRHRVQGRGRGPGQPPAQLQGEPANGSTAAGHVTPCSSLIGWRGAGERGGEAGLQHRAVRLPRGRGGGLGLQVMRRFMSQ